jgi:hypothetical protein
VTSANDGDGTSSPSNGADGITSVATTDTNPTSAGTESAGTVSVVSQVPGVSYTLSSPDADTAGTATEAAAQPGQAPTAVQAPAETAVQSDLAQPTVTGVPDGISIVTASPETVTTVVAPAESIAKGVQEGTPALQAIAADLSGLHSPGAPGFDNEDPGGFYSPGDPAADNADKALAEAGFAPFHLVTVDPTGLYMPSDLSADYAVDENAAARALAEMEAEPPGVVGPVYVIGGDIAAGLGFGGRIGVQFSPELSVHMMGRGWLGEGAQFYGLKMPGTQPGPESVAVFAQGQLALGADPLTAIPMMVLGQGPVVAGIEGAWSPYRAESDRYTVTPYVGGQFPVTETRVGSAWGIGWDSHNVRTGESESDGAVGWGKGGMNGVAVGARGTFTVDSIGRAIQALGEAAGRNGPPNLSGLIK